MKKLPSTIELVSLLQNESKEVKSSTGGTANFRSVIDFVTFNSSYQDEGKMKVIKRNKRQIAKLLEENFTKDVLISVKDIYSTVLIENGFDKAAQDYNNSLKDKELQ